MYNPTCLITGKTDNLRMFPIRDKNDNMIGWIFLHESIKMDTIDAWIKWDYKVEVKS